MGPAYEEAVRAPERHVALQKALQQLGFVPAGPNDGVYARDTRAGIAAWQSAHGLAVTGLLSDTDARMIEQEMMVSRLPDRAEPTIPYGWTEEIPLKRNGGVYVVAVRINRAITLDFILDSGASDVLIPFDVALDPRPCRYDFRRRFHRRPEIPTRGRLYAEKRALYATRAEIR
jgi:peptidoglycan hydrolase-like protein with peptidoglycan-binding domain